MKLVSNLCLVGSLALNVAFACWFFPGARGTRPSSEPATSSVRAGAVQPNADSAVWPNLHTEDLSELAGRLRAAGFPASMIRAIVGYQLSESFAARRRALEATAQNRPFWQNLELDPQSRLALEELNREQARRLREILGDDDDEVHALMNLDRGWHFGFLPAEKETQVKSLHREFDRRRSEISSVGAFLGSDREKMAGLEREKRAALEKILTSAEMLDYDLRHSDSANSLRMQLAAFGATEQEFRALFEVQRAFDERWTQRWGPSDVSREQTQARNVAYPQLWENFKAVLGPERYALYERAQEGSYQRTVLLAARLQLPAEAPENLWALRGEFEKQADALNRNRALSAEQRAAQLHALATQAVERVTPLLGNARNLELYRQNGGSWIADLAPQSGRK
ncbi:MAG: hypothetical protein ABIZ49_10875 [Opitutaceae bacterium]